jgi:ABC-type multidrug transport system fused ATPase/permease subunit
MALYRMVNVEGGRIMFDGIDITQVPLEKLRASLAIVPQVRRTAL